MQVEIFLVLGMVSEFSLKLGHSGYYAIILWILLSLSVLANPSDLTLVGKKGVLPCYHQMGEVVQVSHLASIDTQG